MSAPEQTPTKRAPAYRLVVVATTGLETVAPFGDEASARAAWRTALGLPMGSGLREARVVRPSGDHRTRERCAWSVRGHFIDRTAEHRAEMLVLAERLTAAAPEGYSVFLEPATKTDWRVVFCGRPTGPHSIDGIVSQEARVLAHWDGYLPATCTAESA